MGEKLKERPAIGARVAMVGGFRGTVVEQNAPTLAHLATQYPERVWVSWDRSVASQFIDWAELEPEPLG